MLLSSCREHKVIWKVCSWHGCSGFIKFYAHHIPPSDTSVIFERFLSFILLIEICSLQIWGLDFLLPALAY